MRIDELNWFDVESYLQKDNRLIVVIGACEQHGYLSLLTDVKIPLALADAASKQTGVLIAPPINYGCSTYFLAYPGTFSIRVTILMDMVSDIVESGFRNGFRRYYFLNGHGGNEPVKSRLYELADRNKGLEFHWYSWWLSDSVQKIAQKYRHKPSHANWLEAFRFTMVSPLPNEDKISPFNSGIGIKSASEVRELIKDGSFGGKYFVEDTIMEEIFTACLKDILNLLNL